MHTIATHNQFSMQCGISLCLGGVHSQQCDHHASGVATPENTWAFAQASLPFPQASQKVVHTGTRENTAFYDINCSPYHRHTPDISTPYASYTFKSCKTMYQNESKTDQGFPIQRLFPPHWCTCITIIIIIVIMISRAHQGA